MVNWNHWKWSRFTNRSTPQVYAAVYSEFKPHENGIGVLRKFQVYCFIMLFSSTVTWQFTPNSNLGNFRSTPIRETGPFSWFTVLLCCLARLFLGSLLRIHQSPKVMKSNVSLLGRIALRNTTKVPKEWKGMFHSLDILPQKHHQSSKVMKSNVSLLGHFGLRNTTKVPK